VWGAARQLATRSQAPTVWPVTLVATLVPERPTTSACLVPTVPTFPQITADWFVLQALSPIVPPIPAIPVTAAAPSASEEPSTTAPDASLPWSSTISPARSPVQQDTPSTSGTSALNSGS
jgi:hypothetical protein